MTKFYASGEYRATDTGCDYAASVRGICCDTHRAIRQEIEIRSGRGGLDTRDAERAKAISAAVEAHAPSLRSDILSAELRTAKTRSERRDAVRRFEASQLPPEEARAEASFKRWLRDGGHSWFTRAAGESTGTAGGYTVPQRWSAELIRLMKDYGGALLSQFELWESPDGNPTVRPVGSAFTAAAAQTENNAITYGPDAVFGQQNWANDCPTYAASTRVSNQLVMDAFRLPAAHEGGWDIGERFPDASSDNRTLDELVMSMLAESLGRVLAPVATTGVYSAINAQGANSGQNGGYVTLTAAQAITFKSGATTELAAQTIDVTSTAPAMVAAVDPAYLGEGCGWTMTSTAWKGITSQVDGNGRPLVDVSRDGMSLLGYPVAITSGASDATASSVSGPMFGRLDLAMTLRVVGGPSGVFLFRSNERYAEYLQTYYRAALRADVAARDARALVGCQYAAS